MLGLGNSISRSDFIQSASLLLDKSFAAGPAAAYSLRRVSSSYSGPAVQIRRASDNVEVNVNFDSDGVVSLNSTISNVTEETTGSSTSLTTAAKTLGQFVANASYTDADGLGSTDSALVQCWYDQSGNSNDVTQNAAAKQPRLISSGAFEVDNSKPAVKFLDSSDILQSSSASEFNSVIQNELYCVASYGTIDVGNQYAAGVQIGGSTRGIMIGTNSSGNDIRYHCDGSGFEVAVGGNISTDTQILHGGTFDGTTRHARLNGASVGTNTDAGGTGTANVYFIGKHPSLTAGGDKKVQEFILYASRNGNESDIESEINTFYSIF